MIENKESTLSEMLIHSFWRTLHFAKISFDQNPEPHRRFQEGETDFYDIPQSQALKEMIDKQFTKLDKFYSEKYDADSNSTFITASDHFLGER
jgi:hypothetical protein